MKKQKDNIDVLDILKSNELFKDLDDDVIITFSKSAKFHDYDKGKVLFLQEDEADNFYIIISGWVKLFRETLDGDEAIIDVLTNGHIFGETSIFDHGSYPYGAEVVEDCLILEIPTELLKDQIKSNPQLSMNMLGSMSRFRKQQDTEIEHRTLQNAPQRIGCFLLRLCKNEEQQTDILIHLPYDKTLIASRLGMKPETFSRALAKLKDNTDITVKGSMVEIKDLQKLVKYSCSACSNSFPCQDLC